MPRVAILLNPGQLSNPDLDLLVEIPTAIESASEGQIVDDWYDYLDDHETIALFLRSSLDAKEMLHLILTFLKENLILENNIYTSCSFAVCEKDTPDGFMDYVTIDKQQF